MALSILDGNQTATTLSTVVSSGQHIPAHTVVSLGATAISNIASAVSGVQVSGTVTVGNLPTIPYDETIESGPCVAVKISGYGQPDIPISGTVTANINGTVPVSGTFYQATQPVSLASVPTHGVTIGAGTAQIGSVTATISGTVPVSGTFYQATQPVSLASVPTHGVTLASTTVTVSSLPAVSGTVTANLNPQTKGPIVEQDSVIQNDPKYMAVVGGVYTQDNEYRALRLGSSGEVMVSSLPAISGTVTANFNRPIWTDHSGTVATAGTVITAISTTERSYLLAQVTTGQMFLNVGATATTLNSIYFSAGQGFAWETSVPQGIVSIISTVTGTNYVLKDG